MSIILRQVSTDNELSLFWKMFDSYIVEIISACTPVDYSDYDTFFSDKYRNMIMNLYRREINPLRILFICDNDDVIGFTSYVIYLDENGKCFLLDFGIKPQHRNMGNGRKAVELFEKTVKSQGAEYIDLTTSNSDNTRFWESNGFTNTHEKKSPEDLLIYRKRL